ncbi:MAG: radical SAM protein, partial [Candidatus Aenigmatarchaeota archaeon]
MRIPLIWDDVIKEYAAMTLYKRMVKGIVAGVAYFGPGVPQVAGAPLHVTWNLTQKCDLECLHCYSEKKKRKPKEELTEKQSKRLIDHLAETGVVSLTLSGGEPLLRKDIFRLIRHAKNRGLYVRIETSGQTIDKKTAKKLHTSGAKAVVIPIDGGYPRTHDIFRQKPGCFIK